ncbi:speckle-type POZ protein-like [Armigeres subalbatus]|uniref:speckle-type POZ protein-like n=1 Tax=Armigeres subalbatus TaxID=124917 RepID=UPI002ED56928
MNLIIEQQSSVYCSVLWCINKNVSSKWYAGFKQTIQFSSFGNKWQLYVECGEVFSLGIEMKECIYRKQSRITFATARHNGEKQYFKSVNHTFTAENKILSSDSWKIRKDFWSICDTVKIWCQFTDLGYEISQPVQLEKQLSMQKENKYTDITIMVGAKPIQAHRFMLATHSPVFEAMLSSDMPEGRQNQITINDFEYNVIEELINFIYSDATPNLEQLACSLFKAADKYGMDRLKARCEKVLCGKITVNNVLKLQVLAELYDAKLLKQMVKHFIVENIAELLETTDWINIFISFI